MPKKRKCKKRKHVQIKFDQRPFAQPGENAQTRQTEGEYTTHKMPSRGKGGNKNKRKNKMARISPPSNVRCDKEVMRHVLHMP